MSLGWGVSLGLSVPLGMGVGFWAGFWGPWRFCVVCGVFGARRERRGCCCGLVSGGEGAGCWAIAPMGNS